MGRASFTPSVPAQFSGGGIMEFLQLIEPQPPADCYIISKCDADGSFIYWCGRGPQGDQQYYNEITQTYYPDGGGIPPPHRVGDELYGWIITEVWADRRFPPPYLFDGWVWRLWYWVFEVGPSSAQSVRVLPSREAVVPSPQPPLTNPEQQ